MSNSGDGFVPDGLDVQVYTQLKLAARALLEGSPTYLARVREPIAKIGATTERFASLGLRMDSAGAAWMLDDERGIVWHNGATSDYTSYLGYDPARQIAVVILTNLSPDYRIPATVLGVKLLMELQDQAS